MIIAMDSLSTFSMIYDTDFTVTKTQKWQNSYETDAQPATTLQP
jgi:hypothetical protein